MRTPCRECDAGPGGRTGLTGLTAGLLPDSRRATGRQRQRGLPLGGNPVRPAGECNGVVRRLRLSLRVVSKSRTRGCRWATRDSSRTLPGPDGSSFAFGCSLGLPPTRIPNRNGCHETVKRHDAVCTAPSPRGTPLVRGRPAPPPSPDWRRDAAAPGRVGGCGVRIALAPSSGLRRGFDHARTPHDRQVGRLYFAQGRHWRSAAAESTGLEPRLGRAPSRRGRARSERACRRTYPTCTHRGMHNNRCGTRDPQGTLRPAAPPGWRPAPCVETAWSGAALQGQCRPRPRSRRPGARAGRENPAAVPG